MGGMQTFQEKTVIVTGAGSGIGRATAALFAERGASVAVAEIDEASGRSIVDEIRAAGGHAEFFATNVADEESIRKMVAGVVAAFRHIDVLVNNAAVFVLHGIETATPDDWRRSLETNVMGPSLVAKHVVEEMKKAGGGAIVNMGSISSFIAQPNFVTYNATKAAVSEMTRCMALDLAPFKIRVIAVCPGIVWSPIVKRVTTEQGMDRATAEADAGWGGMTMLGRFAETRDIAQAIAFLASDEASYITAENLMVDGGYTAK
jgi:dihydroanticapsin dehydrogenase